MGCFLGCFGYSIKHKPRKPANKFLQGNQLQGNGSYQPLESSFSLKLDITERPISSDSDFSDFRDEPKERLSLRIRKKVSFNLNVTTYEPIPAHDNNSTDTFLGSDREKSCGRSKEEMEKEKSSPEGEMVDSGMGSYPLNYRYHNCEDSYDEDDDLEYEENDLDDEDDDDYDDNDDDGDDDGAESDGGNKLDDLRTRQEFSEKFCSVPMESQKTRNNLMPLHAAQDQQLKTLGSNENARVRSQYVYSVLNPVENLTQWKENKAKSKPPLKHQRKENIAIGKSPHTPFSSTAKEPLLFESPVDASLSNWLVSSETMPLKENRGKSDFKGF